MSVDSIGDNGHHEAHTNDISRNLSTPTISTGDLTLADGVNIADPSSSTALSMRSSWLPILESGNHQLVLYNPTSHALTITPSSLHPVRRRLYNDDDTSSRNTTPGSNQLAPVVNRNREFNSSRGADGEDTALAPQICPWCSRPYPLDSAGHVNESPPPGHQGKYQPDGSFRRAPNYFKLLEQTNYEVASQSPSPPLLPGPYTGANTRPDIFESPITPATPERVDPLDGRQKKRGLGLDGTTEGVGTNSSIPGTPKRRFGDSPMAQGYFSAFFKEERRLGMGANGTVYLCQVRYFASCHHSISPLFSM